MKTLKYITIGLATLALTVATGCSKTNTGDAPSDKEQASAGQTNAGDQPGLAKETLLVMLFHHDS